jgi:hypothetical protein
MIKVKKVITESWWRPQRQRWVGRGSLRAEWKNIEEANMLKDT